MKTLYKWEVMQIDGNGDRVKRVLADTLDILYENGNFEKYPGAEELQVRLLRLVDKGDAYFEITGYIGVHMAPMVLMADDTVPKRYYDEMDEFVNTTLNTPEACEAVAWAWADC